jgi:hypothetical protein
LGGAVAGHELLVGDPSRRNDLSLQQRQHDVSAAEHERAEAHKAANEAHRAAERARRARESRLQSLVRKLATRER